MARDIFNNEEFKIKLITFYPLILTKFFSSAALHLMLYPNISLTMGLMKYICNHEERFTHPNGAFSVAFTATSINILVEIICCYLLLFQPTVEYSIIHFVALEVLAEIPHIYMHSLIDN